MRRRPLLLLLVAIGGFLAARVVHDLDPRSRAAAPAGGDAFTATVDHVVDGDTVVVRRDGERITVRLVQIDAPESSATRYGEPDACGTPATAFAKRLTGPGDTVTVEPAGSDAQDQYGRTLAILRLGDADARTFQLAMVRAGWAEPYVFDGNETPILDDLERAARRARTAGRGVWSRCDGRFHTAG